MNRGVIQTACNLEQELQLIVKLGKRYADLPMSLADALFGPDGRTLYSKYVLTLDQDLIIYRKHSRQVIPVMMPNEGRTPR